MEPEPLDLRVDGRRLEAAAWPGGASGEARAPIVLLHEGLGSVGLWRGFPAALAEATGRRVVAFSRFGHGRSEPPPEPRTPAFFRTEALDVLPEVLATLGLEAPLLVGHSDGATIALIHAGRHDVAGVALLAPHVFVEEICIASIEAIREEFRSGKLRSRMARHHDSPEAAFWGWCDVWLDPAFRSWTLDDDAALLHCPTLLIQGPDDPYGTLEQLDRIQARAPGPLTRVHTKGGHSPHLDDPDTVVAAVTAFAADLP